MTNRTSIRQQMAEAIGGRGLTGHSAIYRWLWNNYRDLGGVSKTGRSDWVGVCAMMKRLGVGGRSSAAVNPDNVRKTWARVVADIERHGYPDAEAVVAHEENPPTVRAELPKPPRNRIERMPEGFTFGSAEFRNGENS